MNTPSFLTAPLLTSSKIRHGFFGRAGGVSTKEFTSLNTGLGSSDAPENVAKNRQLCALALGTNPQHLITAYQIHSADVETVMKPWDEASRPKADGMVTKTSGIALSVLAADCMPWLFADHDAGVIGAAHAGWRGALAGILENTVSAMEKLGSKRSNIRACLGPCLRQPNFEVGFDLVSSFLEKYPEADEFFAPGINPDKRQFDLARFGAWRLRESGVTQLSDVDICTLAKPDQYFSYRSMVKNGEKDFGRNLSAIAID